MAEYKAATQLLIANAANLLISIKKVIKSSKSVHALQNNQILNPGKRVPTINTTKMYCKTIVIIGVNDQNKRTPSISKWSMMMLVLSILYQISSAGDTPLLYQLEYLKVGSEQFKIMEEICYKWKEIAFALEFDHHVVERIKYDTQMKGCVESCREVFSLWLKREACQPVTWRRLVSALNVINFGVLASKLDQSLSPSS